MIQEIKYRFLLFFLLLPATIFSEGISGIQKNFPDISGVQQELTNLQQNHPQLCRLHTLAVSPGGHPVTLLEIGHALKDAPAVFLGANFEGIYPVATNGALRFARMLLDSAKYTSGLKWYILPQPNPDAAQNAFSAVRHDRTVNGFIINDDGDEGINEDGFEDLNGDGFITRMREKCPDGTHIISKKDPRLMVPADPSKGERGEYKLYTEGVDNDGDGQLNEDGEGGINVGIAFPHLFPENKKEAGLWPGQTPEVYGIMRFIYAHPEIAMVYTLGGSDFCLRPPAGGRKGGYDLNRIKLPARIARMFHADESQTYSMDEVMELAKEHLPQGTGVTSSELAGMLDLGPAVNPTEEDVLFYTAFSEEYKNYLKTKNFNAERLSPAPAKDGSFELWAYYHLGVPSFSMNLFSVPGTAPVKQTGENEGKKDAETREKQSPEEALLVWSDSIWEGKGFVEWKKFDHPGLGEVEIGGFVPGLATTPGPGQADSLYAIHLPWLLQLTKKLPEISFTEEQVTPMGSGVYKLEIYVENKGYLSWPIAMGQRNGQPVPVVLTLDGDFELLEGNHRTPLGALGSNQVRKFSWLLRADGNAVITAGLESAVFKDQEKQIKTEGQ